jgi:hypothetical protein
MVRTWSEQLPLVNGSFAPNGQVSVSWHIVDRDDEPHAERNIVRLLQLLR